MWVFSFCLSFLHILHSSYNQASPSVCFPLAATAPQFLPTFFLLHDVFPNLLLPSYIDVHLGNFPLSSMFEIFFGILHSFLKCVRTILLDYLLICLQIYLFRLLNNL
jgi:hypothetical protein